MFASARSGVLVAFSIYVLSVVVCCAYGCTTRDQLGSPNRFKTYWRVEESDVPDTAAGASCVVLDKVRLEVLHPVYPRPLSGPNVTTMASMHAMSVEEDLVKTLYIIHFEDSIYEETISLELFSETLPLHTADHVALAGYWHSIDGVARKFVCLEVGLFSKMHKQYALPSVYSQDSDRTYEALFILQNWADGSSSCSRTGIKNLLYEGVVGESGKNVYDQVLEMSNGRMKLVKNSANDYNFHIAGPYSTAGSINEDRNSYYTTWRNAAKAAAVADGYDLSKYNVIVSVHPELPTWGWLGLASRYRCYLYKGYNPPICSMSVLSCEKWVMAHEMGHNFEFGHAAKAPNDYQYPQSSREAGQDYLDYSGFMGNSAIWNKANAPHAVQRGWLDTAKVKNITEAGTFQLSSLDYTPSSSAPNFQAILVFDRTLPYPSQTYYLSLRERIGYSSQLETEYITGVALHKTLENDVYTFHIKQMNAGDTFVLPNRKATIKIDSISTASNPNSATISIYFQWVEGTWGTCSQACGGGTRTRTVTCQDEGVVKPDGACILASKPVTSESCNTQTCGGTYYWFTSPTWTSCSASCGGGTRTRVVQCKASADNSVVADGNCAGSKPLTQESCNTQNCPTWHQGGFGACSATCGTAFKTQTVECHDHNGATVPDSQCTGSKPVSQQSCSVPACVYNWDTTASWGSCTVSCGGGTQTKSVPCRDGSNNVVDDSLCSGSKPSTQQSCNSGNCPNHVWVSSTWGACSVTCGSGTQTRVVQCENNGVASATGCDLALKPASSQSCNAPYSCTPCVGVDCGAHGTCTPPAGQCLCSDGYGGSQCDVSPSISNVNVELPDDSDPQIFWASTGNVSRVSIKMTPVGSAIPVSIATNIINTGTHRFDFASISFPVTANYTVTVFFNQAVYGVSSLVSIDLCYRKLCHNGGTCRSSDGECECPTGFAGVSCQNNVGLCAVNNCQNGGRCVASSGDCNCTGTGYEGSLCTKLPGCSRVCQHRGYANPSCTSCVCVDPWEGDTCGDCGLEQRCIPNGKVAAGCASCICDPGFTGTYCKKTYWVYTLGPFQMNASDASDNRERVDSLFKNDLMTAICLATSRVDVVEISAKPGFPANTSFVRFHIHSLFESNYTESTSLSAFPGTCTGSQTVIPASARGNTTMQRDLIRWGDEIARVLAIPSHAFYRGDLMTLLVPGAASIEGSNPAQLGGTGQPPPPPGDDDDDGSDMTIIYVFCAVGAVVLIAAIVAFTLKKRKLNSKLTSFKKREVSWEGDIGQISGPVASSYHGSAQHLQSKFDESHIPSDLSQPTLEGLQPNQPSVRFNDADYENRPLPPPPPRSPPPMPAFPPGWAEHETEEGYPYWFNGMTGESSWERPTQ